MAKDAAGAALDTQRAAELELLERAILDGEELPFERDSSAITRNIMERILASDTFEAVFRPQNVPAWRDMLDQPVKVKDVHFNPSGFEAGSSVYAVVDLLVIETGEIVTVSTGGQNVLAQLVQMIRHGWQDKTVKMTEKKTTEGYGVLWLQPA